MRIPPMRIYIPQEDRSEILRRFAEVLDSSILTDGKYCRELEQVLSRLLGVKHVISTNSGTGALELMLRSRKSEGEVIVTTETFTATIYAIRRVGCRPVLADVGGDMSLDPSNVTEKLTSRTTAIVTVHLGGFVSERVKELQEISAKNGVLLFEDAAQAMGSKLGGKFAGSLGDGAGFSFFPTKVAGSAEGGFLTTNDDPAADLARTLRDQGKIKGNLCTEEGYNWRMNEFQAIIALEQINRLEQFISNRERIAKVYADALTEGKLKKKLVPLIPPEASRPNWYKYISFLSKEFNREKLKVKLQERGIALSGDVYEVPCHLQPVFKSLGYRKGDFPVAEGASDTHICLPMKSDLTAEQARFVVETLEAELN